MSIDTLLIEAGVGRGVEVLGAETPIDAAEYHVICNLLIHAVDDELPGAGTRRMRRGSGALGLHVMASANSIRTALGAVARLYDMIGDFCSLEVAEVGSHAEIRIRARMEAAPAVAMIEEVMADWLYIKLCYLLDMPVRLTCFRTTAADHPALGLRHPYFDCLVEFGDVTALRLPSSYLDLAPRAALSDQPTVDATLYWLGQMTTRRGGPPELDRAGSISNQLLGVLLQADLPVDACCAELRLRDRDLRRSLLLEGTGFREVRRAALVRRLRPLIARGLNQEDIATELDYSDGRSLRRGVKLATGLTMTELRLLRADTLGAFSPTVIANLRPLLVTP